MRQEPGGSEQGERGSAPREREQECHLISEICYVLLLGHSRLQQRSSLRTTREICLYSH
jgi:hypothetical protein